MTLVSRLAASARPLRPTQLTIYATVAVTALVAVAAGTGVPAQAVDAPRHGVSASERGTAAAATAARRDDTSSISLVQANLDKDQGTAKFDKDLATVFAEHPDFITFNEVQARDPEKLAPAGYDMFRTPGPRTGWAPVVWDSAKWTALEAGTWQISSRPDGLKKRKGPLVGVRYANWATLTNAGGDVVSVISAHVAPNDRDTAQLLVPSLKRLRTLSNQLGERGPVLLGGDFNMGYHSSRYQPQYLAGAGLKPTYELTGTSFPTHKRGGTIDYVFLGPTSTFAVTEQYPVLLNSDHRMLVARMQLLLATPPPTEEPAEVFAPGTIVAKPSGTDAERRAIVALQRKAIRATPSGAAIHVASRSMGGTRLLQDLIDARRRGVNVTVIAGKGPSTERARELRSLLGLRRSTSNYFTLVPKAWSYGAGMAPRRKKRLLDPTVLLISRAGATDAFALVADSSLATGAVSQRSPRPAKAVISTSASSYDSLYRGYLGVISRTY